MTVIYNFRSLVQADYTLNGATYTDHGDGSVTFANSTGAAVNVHKTGGVRLLDQLGVDYAGRTIVETVGVVSFVGTVLMYSPDGSNSTFNIDSATYNRVLSAANTVAGSSIQYNYLRIADGASVRLSYWWIYLTAISSPRILSPHLSGVVG